MLKLLKNVELLDGSRKNILFGEPKILEVADVEDPASLSSIIEHNHFVLAEQKSISAQSCGVRVIECENYIVSPGILDCHVHVLGGGGEKGPDSRTPPLSAREMVNSGVTSFIGLLGTDFISRSSQDLHAKIRSLAGYGLKAWMLCGSYQMTPVVNTLTGSVHGDICHVDEVLGVGEVCVSDFRGNLPTPFELARLANEANVAGMVSGKKAVVHCHIGNNRTGIEPLLEAVQLYQVPIYALHPTHCSRSDHVLEQVKKWLALGGTADFTADQEGFGMHQTATSDALHHLRLQNFPISQFTLSSDAHGSFSMFDASGNVTSYGMFTQRNLAKTLSRLIHTYGWTRSEAMSLCTTNIVDFLKLPNMGRIQQGCDADLLLFQRDKFLDLDHGLDFVFSGGRKLKEKDWVQPEMFDSYDYL